LVASALSTERLSFCRKKTSKENEATVAEHRKDFSPIQLIGQKKFGELVDRHGVDRGVRKFSTEEMTDALLEAAKLKLNSFREAEGVLGVARSTLSNAMTNRCSGFFMDLCDEVLRTFRTGPVSAKTKRGLREIFAIDSSEIDAHGSLFNMPGWAKKRGQGRTASAKLHVVWNVDNEWIEDFSVTGGRKSDSPAARKLAFMANKIYVFDRAYLDFNLWTRITDAGSCFVTRLKTSGFTKFVEADVITDVNQTGVLYEGEYEPDDQVAKRHEKYLEATRLRHVVYRDPVSKKLFHFVSSDPDLTAQQITDVYKRRWAVELLFRWLKGHLDIRRLPLKNQNAIEIQLAISVLLLLLLRLKQMREKFQGTLWALLRELRMEMHRKARAETGDNSGSPVMRCREGPTAAGLRRAGS